MKFQLKTEPNPRSFFTPQPKRLTLNEPNIDQLINKRPIESSHSLTPQHQSKTITVIHFEDDSPQNKNSASIPKFDSPPTIRINRAFTINVGNKESALNEDFSTREWLGKKRSVTFANIPLKRYGNAYTNVEHFQRCSKDSEIMKYIILRKKPFFSKMLFFLKKFIIYHIFSAFLSLVFMGIQKAYGKYCFLPPNCLCHDELVIKVYTAFKDYFTYWLLYIIAIIQSVIIRDLFHEKTNFMKILYFSLSSIFTFFYLIFYPEATFRSIYIYLYYLLLVFCMEVYTFRKMKLIFKEGFWYFMKINQVAFVMFFNYAFYLFFYQLINASILDNLSYKNSKNIINLYISLYTLIVSFFLKKFVLIYAEFLIKLNQRNTYAIINIMRITLCVFMSLPAANLLKFDRYDWGGWLLLVSFGNFLLSFYFKIDCLDIFLNLIRRLRKTPLQLTKKTSEDIKIKTYIEKLFSGCVLDIQLISCFRLTILFCSNHWAVGAMNGDYYKDCSFEINEKEFVMSIWGLLALVIINVSLAIFIFLYMIKMKNLIILYKIKHNFLYNVCFLYFTHSFFEANLNMFYLYLSKN